MCLVLFGTPDTANNLSDNGYDNITEARPMGMVDLDLLQYVKSEIPPSNLSADCIFYRLIDLVEWLVDELIGYIDWLIDWLIDSLMD